MVIYYFNSNFKLFKFNDYKDIKVKNFQDVKETFNHVLFYRYEFDGNYPKGASGESKVPKMKKVVLTAKETEDVLINISNKDSYDFFNSLTGIFPTLIFSKIETDVWSIFEKCFTDNITGDDKALLKSCFKLRISEEALESELDRLESLDYISIDKPGIYKALFLSIYEYSFVWFSKFIEFPFSSRNPITSTDYSLFLNKDTFIFDIKDLTETFNRCKRSYETSNDFQKVYVSDLFCSNLLKASKLNSLKDMEVFLKELNKANKISSAKKSIFNSFIDHVTIDRNKTKKSHGSILIPLYTLIIYPLFTNFLDPLYDKEKLDQDINNLSRKK